MNARLAHTLTVGAGTLASRLLGVVRDATIAWLLGGSGTADALTAALRIPYMVRRLFGEGTLSMSLTVACLRESLKNGGTRGQASELALAVTRRVWIWGGLLTVLLMLGADGVMAVIAPGVTREQTTGVLDEAVLLFRICIPYAFFALLAAGNMAALHSHERFLLPSLTPALFNCTLLGCAGLALFAPSHAGVLLACGVLGGGLLQWLVQIPAVRAVRRSEKRSAAEVPAAKHLAPPSAQIRAILRRLPAGILGAAVPQLAFLVASALASLLPEGHMSALFYAERLLEFPLGVLGAAVGMVAAPRMAVLASRNPEKAAPVQMNFERCNLSKVAFWRKHRVAASAALASAKPFQCEAAPEPLAVPSASFSRLLAPAPSPPRTPASPAAAPDVSRLLAHETSVALLLALGLTLPAAAGLLAVAEPLVSCVLGHGAFSAEAVSSTALALCAYAPGLPAYALSRPLLAACHAVEDSRTPLWAAGPSLLLTALAGYALLQLPGDWRQLGPPLGVTLGLWCNAGLLWRGLRRSLPLDRGNTVWWWLFWIVIGTGCTFVTAHHVVTLYAGLSDSIRLSLAVLLGALVYGLLCGLGYGLGYGLGCGKARCMKQRLRKKT